MPFFALPPRGGEDWGKRAGNLDFTRIINASPWLRAGGAGLRDRHRAVSMTPTRTSLIFSAPAPRMARKPMPMTKQLTADILFLAQIGLAVVFGGSEFLRLLNTSQGIPIFWLASWLAFLLINLVLTIRAYVSYPSRVTLQAFGCYALWTVIIASDLVVLFLKGTDIWRAADSITAIVVAAGIMATLLWGYRRGHGLGGPIVHGYLGVLFIGIPQITLAYTIFQEGGQGLAGTALLASNFSILIRLGLLGFAISEAGWDRNRKGAAMSEFANEISWLLVTLAWLIRYPHG
jgi:hypothetical protein